MSAFDLTPEARADLTSVADYVAANSGPDRADRLLQDVRDACHKLADMPGVGHFRDPLLDRRFRFWVVHAYVVAYRWETTPIQVIAVVHGARDLAAFFRRRAP